MVCYYHPDRPAVGLCKYCQRGLCSDCAAPAGDSLACRNLHEEQVQALEVLDAEEYFAIQAGRVRLRAKYDLLRDRRSFIQRLWILTTQIFRITSAGLFDDWASPTLGSHRELFGEQEI